MSSVPTPTPAPKKTERRVQSADDVVGKEAPPRYTPEMLPVALRERFRFTPGLHPYLPILLNVSGIQNTSPIPLIEQFLSMYETYAKKGEMYPALLAYRSVS
jgi:hypothetical protein